MNIQSLENLTSDNNNIFDLYTEVIVNNNTFAVYTFTCTARHNMRFDLVCLDIYNNINNIDVLSIVNGIINLYTVQSEDIIYYLHPDDIDNARSNDDVIAAVVKAVSNANKGKEQKIDSTRTTDKSNQSTTNKAKQYIPPHIIQQNNNVDYNNGNITLKPNF